MNLMRLLDYSRQLEQRSGKLSGQNLENMLRNQVVKTLENMLLVMLRVGSLLLPLFHVSIASFVAWPNFNFQLLDFELCIWKIQLEILLPDMENAS